jgi:hypothetical protein
MLYKLCYIRVEDMEGLDPVLALYCLESRVLDGLRLISLTGDGPLYVAKTAARSTAGWEPEDPIQLNAAVPPGMVADSHEMRDLVKAGISEHYGDKAVPA